jgi:hypothetical protein
MRKSLGRFAFLFASFKSCIGSSHRSSLIDHVPQWVAKFCFEPRSAAMRKRRDVSFSGTKRKSNDGRAAALVYSHAEWT